MNEFEPFARSHSLAPDGWEWSVNLIVDAPARMKNWKRIYGDDVQFISPAYNSDCVNLGPDTTAVYVKKDTNVRHPPWLV